MTLSELAAVVNWVHGLVIEDADVQAQAIAAARLYVGWGEFASIALPADSGDDTLTNIELSAITGELVVSAGEWAVVSPLFRLYVERENARALEASRGQGVDVYGRDVNMIESDIRQYETVDMPRLAFCAQPESI